MATLGESEKHLLLAMINSSLFDNERIKIDDLKLAYRAIFGKTLKDRDLIETLLSLERIGLIYLDRSPYSRMENIIIPEHVYTIQSQIESKLPKVVISESEEKSH